MDIHKPKPWHGVREFLKEYAIIVVGVLTALGAEAVVQTFHEARLSDEAKQAVRDEMNVDITNMGLRLGRNDDCVVRRFSEIEVLLDRADTGAPFAPPTNIAGPSSAVVYTQRWQAATAGGRTSLLASEEQRAFGRVYAALERMDRYQEGERLAWNHMRAIVHLRRLSPAEVYDQRIALADARANHSYLRQQYKQAAYFAGLVGVKGDAHLNLAPGSGPSAGVPAICQPMAAVAPTTSPTTSQGTAHGHP